MLGRRTAWQVALSAWLLSSAAFGYYHFIRFPSRNGPFNAVPEKFDLAALPGKTIRYYIAESGPTRLADGDSFPALVSQIGLAAKAWNDVQTSDLKLAFGGLINPAVAQNSPGIDIVFDDDLPPGVIAQGGPVSWDYAQANPGTEFIPVVRAKVQLRRDLTRLPLPGGSSEAVDTFDEAFFLTLVHEFGHALGLQHSLTSGVMSTRVTRGTTKARPLSTDDAIGLSLLYPAPSFRAARGGIRGRVFSGSVGMNMASVVAISPSGTAVSALSNPDGSYLIDGLLPGVYFVYAHPLPPADSTDEYPANIFPPWDNLLARGSRIATRDMFTAQFFRSTVVVLAGQVVSEIDFSVSRRNNVPVSSIYAVGFIGQNLVKPAPVLGTSPRATVYAYGQGIATSDGNPVSGLQIEVLGGGQAANIRRYAAGYIQFDLTPPLGEGPRHLVFTSGGYPYLLPFAFNLIQRQPPNIASVTAGDENGVRIATIAGTNLSSETRILFDGVQAAFQRTNPDGSLVVQLPQAAGGHRARVVALNPDGQSSIFAQGRSVTQFQFDSSDGGLVTLSRSNLPAGTDAMIEVSGVGTNFQEGQTAVGFGSSDIFVRRVWVVSPTRLLVNVSVADRAAFANTTLTVQSGLQLLSSPFAFQIMPPNPQQMNVASTINPLTGLAGFRPGGAALATIENLPDPATLELTVSGRRVSVDRVDGPFVYFQVPPDLAPGPAVLQAQSTAGARAFPLGIQIDGPPPVILRALAGVSTPIDGTHFVRGGDLMTLVVGGLPNAGERISVRVGGYEHAPIAILPSTNGTTQVQIILHPDVAPGNDVAVTLSVDTRITSPFPIVVR
jgi:hypothetical protein